MPGNDDMASGHRNEAGASGRKFITSPVLSVLLGVYMLVPPGMLLMSRHLDARERQSIDRMALTVAHLPAFPEPILRAEVRFRLEQLADGVRTNDGIYALMYGMWLVLGVVVFVLGIRDLARRRATSTSSATPNLAAGPTVPG